MMNGERPTRFWLCSLHKKKMKRWFSGRTYALELLANQQKDGESPIQNIIMGLKEELRERTTSLSWTIKVPWRWATCEEASGPSRL